MKVLQTDDFKCWLNEQLGVIKDRVLFRIYRIEYDAHFGDVKFLGDQLSELRWKNGLRVYFSRPCENIILFLIGGRKNEQKKNIKKARLLISRYANYWTKEHRRIK